MELGNLPSRLVLTAIAVGLLYGGAAQSAVYTSEASFIAAAGSATLPLPTGPTGGDFTDGGFSFNAAAGSSFVIDTSTYGRAIPGEDNLLLNSTESFDVTAPGPIRAFGFAIYRPSNSAPIPGDPRGPVACNFTCGTDPFTVALYNGATFVNSFSFTPVQDTIEFHGYASSTAFDTIKVIEGGSFPGNIGDEYFADFRFGRTAAVPEPATWAMMLVGFGGLGLMARRRRSAAA
jgi:hypothetical protein